MPDDAAPNPLTIDERISSLLAAVTMMKQEHDARLHGFTQTIDQRLERLTDRHEALTQTVEMLALENRQMTVDNRQRDKRMAQIMEGIARLLHVAEIHEQRITNLEEPQK